MKDEPTLEQSLSSLHWRIINDTVMGGKSFSSLTDSRNMLSFEGKLSSANNGGFASVHCLIKPQIRDGGKISITVKGDNRRYQLRLKTANHADGEAYKVEFTNNRESWHIFSFEQNDFVAVYRGRILDEKPKLKFSDISQIAFLIADKQWEQFKLDIKEIKLE
ncbi:CIA30 family protein [Shewanella atlantica]|uniref:CIA30 family protein n=1 Tax=Shewanella atlantica TaxID=271099 RepID=UPI0037364A01